MASGNRKQADYIKPMLAQETDKPFDDREWIFEVKWDGYRAIAEVNGRKSRLYSRNGQSFLQRYPKLAEAIRKLNGNAIIDGEIVVIDEEGISRFQQLQEYGKRAGLQLCYCVFDLLELENRNCLNLPLTDRKTLLKKYLPPNDPMIRYSDHLAEHGKEFFDWAVKKGLEGIMAKNSRSHYVPGKRTSQWLKIKHRHTEDVIIAGFTEPRGEREYFGALVLGIIKNGQLRYAGHTGTGFSRQKLKTLYQKLKPLTQKKSPFREAVKTNQPVTWVKPELVAEVQHTEWTRDGRMRHPVFIRLRTDKTAKEAVMTKKAKPKKTSSGKTGDLALSFGAVKVPFRNPDKIFWPEEKISKSDLWHYYEKVAPAVLRYLHQRPLSLLRNPDGIRKKGFFQKDAGTGVPEWMDSISIHSESSQRDLRYYVCNNKASLAYLVNLGCIELNPWHSRVGHLEEPDYLIIDIDPTPSNSQDEIIDCALAVKEVLDRAGATACCKTSGATGLHIYVPLNRRYSYEQGRDFAQVVASFALEQLPGIASMERNLKKRGKKIYLDCLQNSAGQTVASAYCVRPFPGATVSTPLDWKELKHGLIFSDFTIKNLPARLKKKGDLFRPVLGKGIDMEKCLKRLGA